MSEETPDIQLPPFQVGSGNQLFMIVVTAYRTDTRSGRFKVKPDRRVGPVLAASLAEALDFAEGVARKVFPDRAQWEGRFAHACAVPDHLVTGVAETLGMLTPRQVEQQVATAREEGFQRGREQGLRDAKQQAKQERQAVRKGGRRAVEMELGYE